MAKSDIQTREDIEKLIRTFYNQVRNDELLGSFFHRFIKNEEEWEKHYRLLTAFWELNLMEKKGFDGNPAKAHHGVDKSFMHSITTLHFERWLALWCAATDQMFEGAMAEKAKTRAANMAKGMYKRIINQRPGGFVLPGGSSGLSFG